MELKATPSPLPLLYRLPENPYNGIESEYYFMDLVCGGARIHTMELKDSSVLHPLRYCLYKPRIHTMELKERVGFGASRAQAVRESIQWN